MAEEEATPQEGPEPHGDEPKETTDWKAESRKWEKRAKENAEAAEKLKKLEEAQMTEAEKAAAKTAELQAQLDAYKAREQQAEWRKSAAEKTGVPEDLISGDTEEGMLAFAERLKPHLKAEPAPVIASQGAKPQGGKANPAELFGMALDKAMR